METLSAVGQDSHRFTEEEKPLYLGGVLFEGCRGLAANSDGDVVLHAITNAVSGLTGVNILGEAAGCALPERNYRFGGISARGAERFGTKEYAAAAHLSFA